MAGTTSATMRTSTQQPAAFFHPDYTVGSRFTLDLLTHSVCRAARGLCQ